MGNINSRFQPALRQNLAKHGAQPDSELQASGMESWLESLMGIVIH